MKKAFFLLAILTVISTGQLYAQGANTVQVSNTTPTGDLVLDRESFLIGSFIDYIGRFYQIEADTEIEYYYPTEEEFADFILNFINQHYHFNTKPKIVQMKKGVVIDFPALARPLNHTFFDDEGFLIANFFDTPEKKYSFLTGLFLRSGQKINEEVYRITISNNGKKADILYGILKDLKAENILYKSLFHIPHIDEFFFKPTPEMKAYVNEMLKLYPDLKIGRDPDQSFKTNFYDGLIRVFDQK